MRINADVKLKKTKKDNPYPKLEDLNTMGKIGKWLSGEWKWVTEKPVNP